MFSPLDRVPGRTDSGSATVEFALVLPALVGVLLIAAGVLMALRLQFLCLDSARVGARVIELGGGVRAGLRAAGVIAPPGAVVSVQPLAGSLEQVVVDATFHAPGPLGALVAPLHVQGRAAAVVPARAGRR